MGETAILIAAHKAFDPPAMEGYLPVQVGAALAAQDLGFQRDDEGENISEKNPQYCELTGHYWAWKNLPGPETMGLVHYRRYFVHDMYAADVKSQILTAAEAEKLLEHYDIILPKPVYKLACNGILFHDRPKEVQNRPMVLLEELMRRRCPEYMPSFEKFAYGRRASFGNMLIAKWEVFCAYSAWMFPLLEEFEQLGAEQGVLAPRMCGFISEYLLCIWADHNFPPEKILFMDVANTEDDRRALAYRMRKVLVKLGLLEPVSKAAFAVYYKLKGC